MTSLCIPFMQQPTSSFTAHPHHVVMITANSTHVQPSEKIIQLSQCALTPLSVHRHWNHCVTRQSTLAYFFTIASEWVSINNELWAGWLSKTEGYFRHTSRGGDCGISGPIVTNESLSSYRSPSNNSTSLSESQWVSASIDSQQVMEHSRNTCTSWL